MPGETAAAAAVRTKAAKVAEFTNFIDTRLKVDLARATEARDKTQAELDSYCALATDLEALEAEGTVELRTLVELGPGVRCAARVADSRRVFVALGLGFHAELTRPEALAAAAARATHLRARLAIAIDAVARITAHLELASEGVRELLALPADGA